MSKSFQDAKKPFFKKLNPNFHINQKVITSRIHPKRLNKYPRRLENGSRKMTLESCWEKAQTMEAS